MLGYILTTFLRIFSYKQKDNISEIFKALPKKENILITTIQEALIALNVWILVNFIDSSNLENLLFYQPSQT